MQKERVYISGAITGVPNYKERFAKAQKELEAQGYAVINPAAMNEVFPEAEYEEFMFADIHLLALCDVIYMLNNWQKSRGANREIGFAMGREMKILYEPEGSA